jgi:uncharacterized membrane protein YczE
MKIHSRQHGTMPPTAQLVRRLTQLYAGLVLYGVSSGLMVLAGLGNNPWNVLHEGLARQTGLGTGFWTCIVGALLLVIWIPLRQWPGLGTLSNVVVIGLVLELTITHLPAAHALPTQATLLATGIVLNGIATGLYIGAELGPGPRDGLMTGLSCATGASLRATRVAIELTVLASGVLLGGTAGLGTIAYALAIGPLAQIFVPLLSVDRPRTGNRSQRATWRRNGAASSPRPVASSTIGSVSSRLPWRWTFSRSQSRIVATSPAASASSCAPSSASSVSHS